METSTPDVAPGVRQSGTTPPKTPGRKPKASNTSQSIDSSAPEPSMAPAPREFQFVDVNNVGSRKQARSHVMRQYLKEKRKQQNVRLETTITPGTGSSSSFTPLQWRKREYNQRTQGRDNLKLDLRPKASEPSGSEEEEEEAVSSSALSRLPAIDAVPYQRRLPLPSPKTPLSAAKKDPFATTPVPLGDDGFELMDYYISVVPGLIFRSGVRATYLFNPIRDVIFKEAMTSPFIFQASVLAFASGYKARWYGFKETEQSKAEKAKALRFADETARQDGGRPSNALIMGVASLAHWEDRWGNVENSHKHISYAQRTMRDWWNMSIPRPRMPAETWMHWLSYTLTPKPISRHERPVTLLGCIRAFYKLMQHHVAVPIDAQTTKRYSVFKPGTALHRLFSIPRIISNIPVEQYVFSVMYRLNIVFRTSSLLYIHLALWDYRESPEDLEEYLTILDATVRQHELDRFPSTSLLLWVMLDGEDHPRLGNPGRAWIVGDTLNEAKHLTLSEQESLNTFMLALLMQREPPTNLSYWRSLLEPSKSSYPIVAPNTEPVDKR